MFIPISLGAVKDKMKNKVFTAAVVLGLAVTTFMVISPVLAQSYWGNDIGEEFVPPMYGGWYANESMPYWDQNGTYHMPTGAVTASPMTALPAGFHPCTRPRAGTTAEVLGTVPMAV